MNSVFRWHGLLKWVGFFVLPLSFSPLCAQPKYEITGYVKDSTNQRDPIAYATVIARGGVSNKVLGYTNTDSIGYYNLALPYDSVGYSLTVRFIGYRKKQKQLNTPSSLGRTRLDFYLTPEDFQLNEVVIEGRKARIQVSGDTTAYEVAAFASESDENIEDLLKKLPGITVGKDGTLFFKGKKVRSVMIDGDDLLGEDYRLATRNARSDLLAEVQAIENYHENPLLKDIEGGQGTILNLKIKEERKSAAFGNIALKYGNGHSREVKANVFSYLKGLKAFSMVGHNNIGQSNGPPTQISGSLAEIEEALEAMQLRPVPFLNQGRPRQGAVFTQRINFNNEWVGSTNLVGNLGEKTKAKLSLTGQTDQQQRFAFQRSRYLTEMPITVGNERESEYRSTLFKGKLDLTSMISKRDRLVSETSLRYEKLNAHSQTLFTNASGKEEIAESSDSDEFLLEQSIYYTHRFQGYKALIIKGNYIYGDIPQHYQALSDSTRYNRFFELPESDVFTLNQRASNQQHLGQLTLKMPIKIDNSLYTIKANLQGKWQDLTSEASLQEEGKSNKIVPKGYTNNLSDKVGRASIGSNYEFSKGWFELEADLTANFFYRSLLDAYDTDKEAAFFYILPDITARAAIGEKLSLDISYRYDFQPRKVNELFSQFVFQDFMSVFQGLMVLRPEQSHILSLAFRFDHNERIEKLLFLATYGYNRNNTGSQAEVTDDFQVYRPLLLGASEYWLGKVSYSRFFSAPGVNIELGIEGLRNLRETLVNAQLGQADLYNITYRVGLGKVLGDFFSFGGGVKLQQQVLKSERGGARQQTENTFMEGFFNAEISHRKKALSMEGEWLRVDGQWLFFVDAKLSWNISKKTTLYLTARNLANTKEYRQVNLTDYVNYTRGQRLIPRLILLGVNWNF